MVSELHQFEGDFDQLSPAEQKIEWLKTDIIADTAPMVNGFENFYVLNILTSHEYHNRRSLEPIVDYIDIGAAQRNQYDDEDSMNRQKAAWLEIHISQFHDRTPPKKIRPLIQQARQNLVHYMKNTLP